MNIRLRGAEFPCKNPPKTNHLMAFSSTLDAFYIAFASNQKAAKLRVNCMQLVLNFKINF